MPNIVNKTLITEGTTKFVMHIYLESDGNEGEFNNALLVDFKNDLTVPIVRHLGTDGFLFPRMTITQAWWNSSWFDVTLSFDSSIPQPVVVLARDSHNHHDFRYFGGIKDRTTSDSTGNILISTKDFAPLGSNGMLVLEVKKH